MKTIKQFRFTLIIVIVLIALFFIKRDIAVNAVGITSSGAWQMLSILPPVLIIMNILDMLIPKETVIRHMGEGASIKGFLWALLLGTFAAGPLYLAFPIAALLAKKQARMACMIFFLSMWTVTKLPMLSYELSFFGLEFTALHAATGIVFYYFMALALEQIILKKDKEQIYKSLSEM